MKFWVFFVLIISTFYSASGQITTHGSCIALANSCYSITQNINNQLGGLVQNTPIDLSQPQHLKFLVNLGSIDANGADGICFVLYKNLNKKLGIGGEGVGYQTIYNSLGVEFDTWQNTNLGDPWYDHMAIVSNGSNNHNASTNLGGPSQMLAGVNNLEDGQDHVVEIIWEPSIQKFSVRYDCIERLSYTGNIITQIFGGQSLVYWGWVGSTGGAYNYQKVCLIQNTLNHSPIADTTVCANNSLTLNLPNLNSNYTYTLTNDAGQTLNPLNLVLVPTDTTQFYLQISEYCTTVYDTFFVNTYPSFTPPSTLNYNICEGDSQEIVAFDSLILNYSWNTGAVTSSIFVDGGGTYTTTLTDIFSCTYLQSHIVQEFDTPIMNSLSNVTICESSSYTAIASNNTNYSYLWSTGETTPSITSSNSGWYGVTVSESFNAGTWACSATDSFYLTVSPLPIVTIPDTAFCAGDSILVLGGPATNQYLWSNGSTANQSYFNQEGYYSLQVEDTLGCIATDTFFIDELTYTVTNQITPVNCNQNQTGAIALNVAGESAPFNFIWNTGSIDSVLNQLTAGSYTVTVSNSFGCSTTETYTITQPNLLVIIIDSVIPVACFGYSDASIYTSASGGTLPYSYLWSNGETTSSIQNQSAANYTITITDANGCTGSQTIVITEPVALSASITEVNTISCFGDSNAALSAQVLGGSPPYTYAWSNGNSTSFNSNLPAGLYSITITDSNGCTTTVNHTINQPTALTNQLAISEPILCFGNSNGAIVAQSNGGVSPYSYNWNTGAQTDSIFNLSQGIYTITVTDFNGCSIINTIQLQEPNNLQCSIALVNPIDCFGSNSGVLTATSVGGTQPYTYQWNNQQIGSSLQNLIAGNYSVTVTDANNCSHSNSFQLNQPQTIGNTFSAVTASSCSSASNGSATANPVGGIGGYSYNWSNGQTTQTVSNTIAGNYTVTITDANNCIFIDSVSINYQNTFAVSANLIQHVSCFGGANAKAYCIANGGILPLQYAWSNGQNTDTLMNASAGNYTVTVTDSVGCSNQTSILISEPTALVVTAQIIDSIACFGDSNGEIQANISGGTQPYNFAWNTNQSNLNISNLSAFTYTISVTDSNGCTEQESIVLTEPDSLVATILVNAPITCFGTATGALNCTVTGGTLPYNYLWNTNQSTSTIQLLIAANYQITVTDGNNCQANQSYFLSQPDSLIVSIQETSNITCNGYNNGALLANTIGGTAPFSLAWNNNQTTATNTNLLAGNYALTVTDTFGCIDSAQFMLTQPTPLQLNLAVVDSVICTNSSNGSVQALALGGTPNYTFNWNTGSSSTILQNIPTGWYFVQVSDSNLCVNNDSIFLPEITSPQLQTQTTNEICQGDFSGAVTTNILGGTHPITYSWSNNPSFSAANQSSLTNGPITITVTDANQCSDTATVSIGFDHTPPPINLGNDTVICFGDTIWLNATINASTYLWNTASTTALIPAHENQTYSVTVTTPFCVVSDSITVQLLNAPYVELLDDTLLCYGDNFQLNVPTQQAQIVWQNNTSGFSHLVSNNGLYWCTLQNKCGTASDSVRVHPLQKPTIQLPAITPLCNKKTTILQPAFDSTASYVWSTGDTSRLLTVNQLGWYSVTATNACGSTTSDTYIELEYCDCEVFVPNSFSPDNNGINDEFGVVSSCELKNYHLQIFNRWGELIFDSNTQTESWNGASFSGTIIQDLYNWRLNYVEQNGTVYNHITKTGYVIVKQ